jgi:hypothetical protein
MLDRADLNRACDGHCGDVYEVVEKLSMFVPEILRFLWLSKDHVFLRGTDGDFISIIHHPSSSPLRQEVSPTRRPYR